MTPQKQRKILVARRPSGQISLIHNSNSKDLLKPGWEYIEVESDLMPRRFSNSQLWDWAVRRYPDRIKTCKETLPIPYEPNLELIRLRQTKKILKMREDRFQELDVEWIRAQEGKTDKVKQKAIMSLKQQLRNMNYDLSHLDDPVKITNFWPEELTLPLVVPEPKRNWSSIALVSLTILLVLTTATLMLL